MKRVLWILLLAALLFTVFAPMASVAKADGPYGWYPNGYGYVFPGSGYNKVCMYAAWNCSVRFVPPYPVSGYYLYPYNTFKPIPKPYNPYQNNHGLYPCTPGLLCGSGYGGGGGYGGGNGYGGGGYGGDGYGSY